MKFSAFAIITFASVFVSSVPLAEPEANAMAVPNAKAEALPFGHKKKMRKMMKTFRLRGTGNAYYPLDIMEHQGIAAPILEVVRALQTQEVMALFHPTVLETQSTSPSLLEAL